MATIYLLIIYVIFLSLVIPCWRQITCSKDNAILNIFLIFAASTIKIDIIMTDDEKKTLSKDTDGLLTYEYIANHIGNCMDDMDYLVDNMISVDLTGQFTASAARYLSAIDAEAYASYINRLIAATIDKDRERRYLGDLIQGIWGPDYASRAEELSTSDDNFRRIYKRLFVTGI